ncbi:MAG: CS1-pili formation C-terminal domain-containing protein [Endozoicomonas sp.]
MVDDHTGFFFCSRRTHLQNLHPGNVETVSFESKEELVLMGKLVDAQGEGIESAIIAGEVSFTRTDQYGIFQVRMPATETQLNVTLAVDEGCTADSPDEYQKRGGVGLVGVIECRQ